ncbi:hypothetical protein [Nocardia sp. bgisy118]|uniref:hypothetical protein n=1 Tax=Nocardia sp. bgisy118 TaxID=3413786 RepID=UPI003F4A85AB
MFVFVFATVPPPQKRVLDQAAGAPTLASAVNIGAFNLGNALSALLGGLVIAAGYGRGLRVCRTQLDQDGAAVSALGLGGGVGCAGAWKRSGCRRCRAGTHRQSRVMRA